MSIIYSIRWRLVYLDGRELDEAPQGGTIMERWPDPVELQLIGLSGDAVMRIPIPRGSKPIFYRRRSIEMNLNGQAEDVQLDATVFGYGRDTGNDVGGKLWLWGRAEKTAVNCPEEFIDRTAIELQLAS